MKPTAIANGRVSIILRAIQQRWCRIAHSSEPMFYGGRDWQCRTCLRRWPVCWRWKPPVEETQEINEMLSSAIVSVEK